MSTRPQLVLAVADSRRELSLLRVGLRGYQLCLRVRGRVQYTQGPVGVPCTRAQALDFALQRAAELGLLDPVHVGRARARAALRRTENAS